MFCYKYVRKAVVVMLLFLTAFLILSCGNRKTTKEAMKYACVGIYTEGGYGSGVIIDINSEEIVILSNLHVLTDWNEKGYVVFSNGARAFGQTFGADEGRDLSFLSIPVKDVLEEYGSEVIKELRSASLLDNLPEEFDFYTFSLFEDKKEIEGKIENTDTFFYELDRNMMLGKANHITEGMSGCPVFDKESRLCGIICAGSEDGTVAAISAKEIERAYKEAKVF